MSKKRSNVISVKNFDFCQKCHFFDSNTVKIACLCRKNGQMSFLSKISTFDRNVTFLTEILLKLLVYVRKTVKCHFCQKFRHLTEILLKLFVYVKKKRSNVISVKNLGFCQKF